eukprot:TRINITY_DN4803_c1_g3_i1.p1 TRINITY_DN4803_c1_g3~~TRINITY_DN4803_c1_g3_i1.p1  ORF type:complete len:785 (+),score=255.80 TRINITY_DN4803_c1_g3_i1:320-2356(+)
MATAETLEALKTELKEAQEKELKNCGSLQETVKKECEAAVEQSQTRLKAMEEQKKKQEELRIAEEKRRKEQAELAGKRLDELSTLVEAAETCSTTFKEKVDHFCEHSPNDVTVEAANKTAEELEAIGVEAKAKMKVCEEFISEKSADMREPWRRPGESGFAVDPKKPTLKHLTQKISEMSRSVEAAQRRSADGKVKITKRFNAKTKFGVVRRLFQKYDKDKDDHLSRKEISAYASGEFKFVIKAADLDMMERTLFKGKGVPLDRFQSLKVFIGVLREHARDSERREERLAKEEELEKKKVQLKEKVEEGSQAVMSTEETLKKVEVTTTPLPAKAKSLKSTEMVCLADEVDEQIALVKTSVSDSRRLIDSLGTDVDPELQDFAAGEMQRLLNRMKSFESRIVRCSSMSTKFRDDISRRESEELDQFRGKALRIFRFHQREKLLTTESLFGEVDKKGNGKIDADQFATFFQSCEKEKVEEGKVKDELSEEDARRLFASLDEEEEGFLSKEAFASFARFFMKVVKETVITQSKGIKDSKTLRRLDLNEACEVLEGPFKEEAVDVLRTRVRTLRDAIDGWVTPVGNQGTVFLQEGDLIMKVAKETILTADFDVGGSMQAKHQTRKLKDPTRKLKEGELVEVREWMKKDASGLMRMRVKTRSDGRVGWATAVGNAGAVFLELA